MGPLITGEHRDRVAGYLEEPALGGSKVVVDGRATTPPGPGYFLGPSLLDGVTPGSRVYDDEIFGPVLSVVRVDTFGEAVDLVNASPYANGTAVFTRRRRGRRFSTDAQVGMVGVNVPIPVPVSRSASAVGARASSATATCTARQQSTSTRTSVTSRARSCDQHVDLGFLPPMRTERP
jgi:acyl-CoA reductase-like NAD-dependent aldehyde dehydrogenase